MARSRGRSGGGGGGGRGNQGGGGGGSANLPREVVQKVADALTTTDIEKLRDNIVARQALEVEKGEFELAKAQGREELELEDLKAKAEREAWELEQRKAEAAKKLADEAATEEKEKKRKESEKAEQAKADSALLAQALAEVTKSITVARFSVMYRRRITDQFLDKLTPEARVHFTATVAKAGGGTVDGVKAILMSLARIKDDDERMRTAENMGLVPATQRRQYRWDDY